MKPWIICTFLENYTLDSALCTKPKRGSFLELTKPLITFSLKLLLKKILFAIFACNLTVKCWNMHVAYLTHQFLVPKWPYITQNDFITIVSRKWFVVRRHQALAWTNPDALSIGPSKLITVKLVSNAYSSFLQNAVELVVCKLLTILLSYSGFNVSIVP